MQSLQGHGIISIVVVDSGESSDEIKLESGGGGAQGGGFWG